MGAPLGREAWMMTAARAARMKRTGKRMGLVRAAFLAPGDRVTVRVRADRGASLAQIESTAAVVVADRGPLARFPNSVEVRGLDRPDSFSLFP